MFNFCRARFALRRGLFSRDGRETERRFAGEARYVLRPFEEQATDRDAAHEAGEDKACANRAIDSASA